MNPLDRLRYYTTNPTEDEAEYLRKPAVQSHTIEVKTPRNGDIPATLENLVKAVTELQSKYFGLLNTSPVAAFEIRRTHPDKIKFQFSTPTVRLVLCQSSIDG